MQRARCDARMRREHYRCIVCEAREGIAQKKFAKSIVFLKILLQK